jgi:uncharacterized protein YfdQ (DUF2303 family)
VTELATGHVPGDIQAAIDAGTALGEPHPLEEIYQPHVVVVPEGGRVEVIDVAERFEAFAERPRRAKGRYTAATVEAFIAYVKQHREHEATTIWVEPTDGKVLAVLNDHGDGQDAPAWRDWTATLALRHTDEWNHWKSRDGLLGGQEDFAEHIEDGLTEIADPTGAELLEIAQTFHATTAAQFRQATRLSDGRIQVRYDEEIDAKAGTSGELAIPQEITLLLAPYVGEEAVELKARLRYRVSGGALRIGYKLDRPERVIRDALEHIAERLLSEFGDHVYLGAAPA